MKTQTRSNQKREFDPNLSGHLLKFLYINLLNLGIHLLIIPALFAFVIYANAQTEVQDNRTLSPYFFVQSEDPAQDCLPLKSTGADVNIAGVIADVHVMQIYKNEGQKPLEAIYIFPASTRAAVYRMKMTIGERVIEAKIEERETAREQYEQAKQEGRSASLLEQQRPNVFQMNVANIMPGDVIKVDLYYTEILIPVEKQYEFVYPTVVGPRYSNQSAENAPDTERWIENPFLTENKDPSYEFNISVSLNGGMPIQKVASTSHLIHTSYTDKNSVQISLDGSEKTGGNRDFILRYQLAGKQVQTGLMLFENEQEKFFLAMIQPPERPVEDEIVPREYIFILDVSGSMNGFPISITKDLMRDLIGKLKSTDKFNVLLFAGGSKLLSPASISASESNINKAIHMIDNETGSGGTELLPALKRAMDLKSAEGFSRTIVIVTDGYVSVEREAFDLIRNNLGKANVFTFGIGSSVNRYLIEGLSRAGKGEAFIVTKNSEAAITAEKFRTYIQSPLLTDIKLSLERFAAYAYEPNIPDVFADRPILIFGKYKNSAAGELVIEANAGKNKYHSHIDIAQYSPDPKNNGLRYLWARDKIAHLADYNSITQDKDIIKEITELGLKYNLLTEFTSFVAIDSQKRNDTGEITTVKQPLPLPQGVNNMAVGTAMARKSTGGLGMVRTIGVLAPESAQAEDISLKTQTLVDITVKEVSSKDVKKITESFFAGQKSLIEFCYKSKIKQSTGTYPQGDIVLKILISGTGKIKEIEMVDDNLNDSDITDCLVEKLGRLRISGINKTENITVELEIKFTR